MKKEPDRAGSPQHSWEGGRSAARAHLTLTTPRSSRERWRRVKAFSPNVTARNSTWQGKETPEGWLGLGRLPPGTPEEEEEEEEDEEEEPGAAAHLQQGAGGGQPGGLAEHVLRGHGRRRQEMAPQSRRDPVRRSGAGRGRSLLSLPSPPASQAGISLKNK